MRSTWAHTTLLAALVLCGTVSSNFAQEVPWDVFVDPESGAACDVVNAGNLEVVVFSDTGELVVVTGDDYTLDEAAFVNEAGVFFFGGIPVGVISFADDGDGVRTVWLLAPDDTVLELDPDTGEPIFTNLFPDGFVGVPCDAFELWDDDDFDDVPDDLDDCPLDFGDDPSGCPCGELDDDLDDVNNCFDLCPNTPLNTFVTEQGCPCNEFDEDADEINDCFDECPNTPLGEVVDSDGCETVIVVVEPPSSFPVFITCGNFSTLTLALTFGTLVTLRLARRRHL